MAKTPKIAGTLAAKRKALAAALAAKEQQHAQIAQRIAQIDRELLEAQQADEKRTAALVGEVAQPGDGENIFARVARKLKSVGVTSVPAAEVVAAGRTLLQQTLRDLDAECNDLREQIKRADRAIARVKAAALAWVTTENIKTLKSDVSELNALHAQAGKDGPFLPVVRCDDPLGWQRIAAGFSRQNATSRHASMRAQSVAWWKMLGHDCTDLERQLDPDRGDDLPRAQAALDAWFSDVTQPANAPVKKEVSA